MGVPLFSCSVEMMLLAFTLFHLLKDTGIHSSLFISPYSITLAKKLGLKTEKHKPWQTDAPFPKKNIIYGDEAEKLLIL